MRSLVIGLALLMLPGAVWAEGRCPPGQYPIGDQNVGGCAPIPGAGQTVAPGPTGEWETRWGAIAEDSAAVEPGANVSTGVAASQKSKRAAESLAIDRCMQGGGKKCRIRMTYHNQCVALADPVGVRVSGAITTASRAESVDIAKANALSQCEGIPGQKCEVYYSACSMSEFRRF